MATKPTMGLLTPNTGDQPGLFDRLLGADSSTYGLLGPADRRGARARGMLGLGIGLLRGSSGPSTLGDAIASGVEGASAGYQGATTQALQGQQVAAQQQVLQQRRRIVEQYPASTHETPQETAARLQLMLPEFIRTGDTEMVGKLTEFLKSVQPKMEGLATEKVRGPDGKLRWVVIDKTTGKITPTGAEADDGNPAQPFRREINVGDKVLLVDENGKTITQYPVGRSPNAERTSDDRTTRMEIGLQKEFAAQTKNLHEAANQYGAVQAALPASLAGDAIAQKALLFSFMKQIHPGAVVRQNEIRDAETGIPLTDKAALAFKQMSTTGQKLSETTVRQIAQQARQQIMNSRKAHHEIAKEFTERAGRFGFNAQNIVDDPFEKYGLDAGAGDDTQSAVARARAALGKN